MEKKYVLAIDQSTQGTKGILFDTEGNLTCRTDLPHQQIINEKGWVSHDLNEIYHNTIQVVKIWLKKRGFRKKKLPVLESATRERHLQAGVVKLESLWHLRLYGNVLVQKKSANALKQM